MPITEKVRRSAKTRGPIWAVGWGGVGWEEGWGRVVGAGGRRGPHMSVTTLWLL